MAAATPVTIPLLNPNEPEALLVSLLVSEGQPVAQGDLLAALETTKASGEITAERDGFVAGLRLAAGQTVQAGELLCYLAGEPGWQPPAPEIQSTGVIPSQEALPAGLRITQPALALAQSRGLPLDSLPVGPLVTEAQVRSLLAEPAAFSAETAGSFDPSAIVVYGGGGHGKMVIDLLHGLAGYRIVGVIDDGLAPGSAVLGVPVLGGGERLAGLHAQGVRLAANAVGGIGNIATRIKIFERLAQAGFACPPLVHPRACVEPSARLSPGAQVFALAYVGSEAQVGFGCIVNTGSIVSHDCELAEFTNISPGAILAGAVKTGRGALVGMGATMNLAVAIGAGARIGNGATVKSDVPEKGVVRAGTIWPAG